MWSDCTSEAYLPAMLAHPCTNCIVDEMHVLLPCLSWDLSSSCLRDGKSISCYFPATFLSQSEEAFAMQSTEANFRLLFVVMLKALFCAHNHFVVCITVQTMSLHVCACMCISHTLSLSRQPVTAPHIGDTCDSGRLCNHIALHMTIFARRSLAAAHTGDV